MKQAPPERRFTLPLQICQGLVDVQRADSFEHSVAIVFHDLYGFSYAEIAKELHCSEQTAKQHHWRAMQRMRESYSIDARKCP